MSGPGPLIFFYDYADPASFILELRLRRRGFVPGSTLHALPFELNPPPGALLDPDEGDLKDRWDRSEAGAGELRLQLRRPRIVPWTRKAHELAFHAAERDCLEGIHEALFRAYLIEGRDLGRVDVLTTLATEHGLDATETRAVLDVDKHREALERIRSSAIREGVTGPATLVLNGKMLHGNPTREELELFLAPGPAEEKP